MGDQGSDRALAAPPTAGGLGEQGGRVPPSLARRGTKSLLQPPDRLGILHGSSRSLVKPQPSGKSLMHPPEKLAMMQGSSAKLTMKGSSAKQQVQVQGSGRLSPEALGSLSPMSPARRQGTPGSGGRPGTSDSSGRPGTSGSSGSPVVRRKVLEPPKEVELPKSNETETQAVHLSPDKAEEMRQRLSLFSTSTAKHSLRMQGATFNMNAIVTCRSMCAFSSRPEGGNQVAVILDPHRQYASRTIKRMAEVCVEYLIVVVQPNESLEDVDFGGFYARIIMLTPGGPTIKTMAPSLVMAATQAILDNCDSMPQFAPLSEGSTITLRAESPVRPSWKDDVEVRINLDGSIWQQVPAPKLQTIVSPREVCEALNINMLALQTDMPIQIVQCVGKHMIVPIRSRRVIQDLDPLADLISEVCRNCGCDGMHLFAMDARAGGLVYTRNLSPLVHMQEEAASASPNAALTAYLHLHRIHPIDNDDTVLCEQGYTIGMKPRPSKISVQLSLIPAQRPETGSELGKGLTAQNHWLGDALGDQVTKERYISKGDRYTSNITDQSRFNLPKGFYERRDAIALKRKINMERAKRQGLVYKEEVKPHQSTAILPPTMSHPAPIDACWVGGTCVPSIVPTYEIRI
eukprot:CAMPEP_0206228784 /NCGR_PEP_ID=MMETSP0047_2-20121206/9348_1 /ASSEMBLY_ACC=CAM_ASM_000192 /TAXON_ID=195065 /ORGANISM="Chroomonas mesostigmatica_cf, Strain CCMP1168" /LENGTH=629 /DNA_ID=CAMNT_0053652039 /DNA_START=99 /DNA_END=1988 /DNA_ORIENTATION=-